MHDDWNTSIAWLEEMRSKDWWATRIESALMSYWVYQHLGNQSPRELAENELLAQVREAEDGGAILRRWAARADRGSNGSRWSYTRDVGGVRIIVFDSREGRVLGHGPRRMADDTEWERVVGRATGDFDHLLLVDSLPFLLVPAFHHLEAWNEAVCARRVGRMGEGAGREATPRTRPRALGRLQLLVPPSRAAARGGRVRQRGGNPPATIVGLGGDVHHAYLAEVGFRRDAASRAPCTRPSAHPFATRSTGTSG